MIIGDTVIPNNLFLAPMAGITDIAFRMICKEFGCGMTYTEMISAKGLYYENKKTEELMTILPEELPVGVQIFGSDPVIMAMMAEKVSESPAAVIDINMGCPAPKIVRNGEGSALLKNPKLAGQIVRNVKKASSKPVTVKIRKGWDEHSVNAIEIAQIIEGEGADAITVHGRTREQYYSGKADWDIIKRVKEKVRIPVIGNGDIFTPEAASEMLLQTGCDGIMVARGSQGNPWLFKNIKDYLATGRYCGKVSARDKIEMALKHLNLIIKYKGEKIGAKEMRKHIPWYLKGLRGSAEIKRKINSLETKGQIEDVLLSYLTELEKCYC